MTVRGKTALARGFSLVELAVVMTIVAFLLGSLMYTLSAQTEQRNFEDTRRRLEQARELILGFAIVNGRLPCPATAISAGDESQTPAGSRICTTGFAGWLPARTIGFQQTDAGGYAVDASGNRIRYAVSIATPYNTAAPQVCRPVSSATPPVTPHFTHKDNLRANGIDCQPNDLLVCKSATGITSTDCGVGTANQIMTRSLVVAIIFSTGKNGAQAPCGTCIDELANLAGNATFVSHTPAPSGATNGEFDDQFTWITVGELYGRLIAAGQLP